MFLCSEGIVSLCGARFRCIEMGFSTLCTLCTGSPLHSLAPSTLDKKTMQAERKLPIGEGGLWDSLLPITLALGGPSPLFGQHKSKSKKPCESLCH